MLTTPRLLLRPLQPADSEALFACRSDAATNRFQGWIPESLQEVEGFISRNPLEINLPQTWFQLAIVLRQSGRFIGDVGIHFADAENRQCELGCTLGKPHHGQGYATEALSAVLDYLFGTLRKHRVTGSVDPANTASVKLLRHLGMRQEAHFRQSLFLRGQWVDDVVFAMLRHEWEGAG